MKSSKTISIGIDLDTSVNIEVTECVGISGLREITLKG